MRIRGPSRRTQGFTLVELVLTTALSGMVFAALASVHGNFSFHQMNNYRKVMIQNQASYTASLMRRDLSQASQVASPPRYNPAQAADSFTNYLLGAKNTNPGTDAPIIASELSTWFYYCIKGPVQSRQLLRYTGNWPIPAELTTVPFPAECPTAITGFTTKDIVAGYPVGAVNVLGGVFKRPQGQDNMVWTHFVVEAAAKPGVQPLYVDIKVDMAVGLPTQAPY